MIFPTVDLSNLHEIPFRHSVHDNQFFNKQESLKILEWFEDSAPWGLIITDFYQQYEFDLLNIDLPIEISDIFSNNQLQHLVRSMSKLFNVELSDKLDITAHKLIKGQVIKVHNDYIPGFETHRLLVQFNRGWSQENGGSLMIFSKNDGQYNLEKAINPVHNSAFSFEISNISYHAVSPINFGDRYTLVISFYKK